MRKTVTIAVPLYNEDQVLPEMVKRLENVISDIDAAGAEATVL
jgi:hypothetical protein